MYLLPCELHAAITCPARERVIGIDRTGCPGSLGGKALGRHAILRDQRLFDRGGAAFGKVKVIDVSPMLSVWPFTVRLHSGLSRSTGAISSNDRGRFRLEIVAGKVKVDAVNVYFFLLLKLLLNNTWRGPGFCLARAGPPG